MGLEELLDTAQYVMDSQGQRQGVLLDWTVWQKIVARLQESDTGEQAADGIVENGEEVAIAREEAAYRAMHQELLAAYAGEYVAIHGEQLVDHNKDGAALYLRMRHRFPDDFVLITPVHSEPEETYYVYSPRLVTAG